MKETVEFLIKEIDEKYIGEGICPVCKGKAKTIITPLYVMYIFCPECKKIFAGVPSRTSN